MISAIDHARTRLASVLDAIKRLKQSEFPYDHSRVALDLLASEFKKRHDALQRIEPTVQIDEINEACRESLFYLQVYVPILGFILRSTNVRNAFEVYAPLLRLSQSILGADTKLIISSEWEFSPFIYRAITGLTDFVLIGLPAPESANPLLIPLAGHELGHSVWLDEDYSSRFHDNVKKAVEDALEKHVKPGGIEPTTWLLPHTWALYQAEEIFCDFFGLRLFAESYLYAFAYLISPGTSGQDSLRYPNITRRISYLINAAKTMGVNIPQGFESCFIQETNSTERATNPLISIADDVSGSLVPQLIKLVNESTASKVVPIRDFTNVKNICEEFRRIAPTTWLHSLTDILNAGWECNLDSNLWKNVTQIKDDKDRDRVLKDLMLKSMEVSEVYERQE